MTETTVHKTAAGLQAADEGKGSGDTRQARMKKVHVLTEHAGNYNGTKRNIEICMMTAFMICLVMNLVKLVQVHGTSVKLLPPFLVSVFTSACAADFLTGEVHWFADTFGRVTDPIYGAGLVRNFREHHLDPFEITRHDFIQLNADSAAFCIPILIWIFVTAEARSILWQGFYINLSLWALFSNSIHMWAHTPSGSRPKAVAWLQRYGLILSPKQHNIHHKSPFNVDYCITTGWLNPFLDLVQFWRLNEYMISSITGETPREDDAYWSDFDLGAAGEEPRGVWKSGELREKEILIVAEAKRMTPDERVRIEVSFAYAAAHFSVFLASVALWVVGTTVLVMHTATLMRWGLDTYLFDQPMLLNASTV